MKMKYFLLALLIPFLGQAAQRLYVANSTSIDSLLVIDIATNTIIDTIDTSFPPLAIAISPNGTKIYNDPSGPGSQVFNVSENIFFKTLSFSSRGFVVLPNNTRVYTGGTGIGDSFVVLDAFSDTIIETVATVSTGLRSPAVSPDGSRVYFPGDSTVTVVDTATNTVVATIPITSPSQAQVSPDGLKLYVSAGTGGSSNITVIDTATNTVSTTIALGGDNPLGIAFTPDGAKAYVAHQFSDNISVIDVATDSETSTFSSTGSTPFIIVITPDGRTAYVSNLFSESIDVIDVATNSITQTISTPVGGFPNRMVITPPSSQVSGERIANIALGLREFSNIVTWTTPTDITTTGYLIFRDSALTDLAAEISDPNILKFEEHNLSEDEAFTYQVVALDQYNNRYLLGSGVFLNFK